MFIRVIYILPITPEMIGEIYTNPIRIKVLSL